MPFIILFLLLPSFPHAQANSKPKADTIYMHTVRVPYNVLVNKTGAITKIWYRKVKVETGYIVKKSDGDYVINDRVMKPDYLKL